MIYILVTLRTTMYLYSQCTPRRCHSPVSVMMSASESMEMTMVHHGSLPSKKKKQKQVKNHACARRARQAKHNIIKIVSITIWWVKKDARVQKTVNYDDKEKRTKKKKLKRNAPDLNSIARLPYLRLGCTNTLCFWESAAGIITSVCNRSW